MQVADDFEMSPEDVMHMPFIRFMALHRLRGRRQIAEHNRQARQEYERGKET